MCAARHEHTHTRAISAALKHLLFCSQPTSRVLRARRTGKQRLYRKVASLSRKNIRAPSHLGRAERGRHSVNAMGRFPRYVARRRRAQGAAILATAARRSRPCLPAAQLGPHRPPTLPPQRTGTSRQRARAPSQRTHGVECKHQNAYARAPCPPYRPCSTPAAPPRGQLTASGPFLDTVQPTAGRRAGPGMSWPARGSTKRPSHSRGRPATASSHCAHAAAHSTRAILPLPGVLRTRGGAASPGKPTRSWGRDGSPPARDAPGSALHARSRGRHRCRLGGRLAGDGSPGGGRRLPTTARASRGPEAWTQRARSVPLCRNTSAKFHQCQNISSATGQRRV